MEPDDPNTDIEREVQLGKIDILYQNVVPGQLMTLLIAAMLAWFSMEVDRTISLVWWLASVVVSVLRMVSAWRFRAATPDQRVQRRWRNQALGGAALGGLVWSAGVAVYMTQAGGEQQVFIVLVTSGMVAGAVPVLASVPEAFLLFGVPPVLAVSLEAAMLGRSPLMNLMAVMAVVFLALMVRSALTFSRVIEGSIRTGLEHRRLARELERSRDAAQEASTAKSRFLATMSHELRTPLNGVLGMAELLLVPGLSAAEREEYARTIHSSGSVLLAQLNDILDLSRIEAGRLQVTYSDFEPEEICREVTAIFQGQARSRGIALGARWMGDFGARFHSDPIRVRQMMMNYVNNALKFTNEGEIELVAQLVPGASERSPQLEFSVRDTGIGIEVADQKRLFEPFYQVDSSDTRAHGGSGLGLCIVRQLSELLGGSVGVQSEPGRGSRFWFRIPALPAAQPPAGDSFLHTLPLEPMRREMAIELAVPAARPDAGPEAASGGLAAEPVQAPPIPAAGAWRVLVVEDSPVNQTVVQTILRKLGCTSQTVGDGQAALAELDRHPGAYDVVLMDCQMPRMDGYEAVRRIRQRERERSLRRVPVIAISAAVFDEDMARCRDVGMDDFLAKPISVEALAIALRRCQSGAPAASALPTA